MKKIILTVAAVFAFGFANAQEATTEAKGFGFSKGNIMVEGNIGFSSNNQTDSFGGTDTEERKMNSLSFNPKAGYFVTDKLAVGVELGIGSSKNETTDMTVTPNTNVEVKNNNFNGGVFARYYFLDLGQRFKTYAEAGLGFGSSKQETNGTENWSSNNFGLGLDLGMNYFVTERFAINFGLANVLGFNAGKTEYNGGGETKSAGVNANINVFQNFFDTAQFGLTYRF